VDGMHIDSRVWRYEVLCEERRSDEKRSEVESERDSVDNLAMAI